MGKNGLEVVMHFESVVRIALAEQEDLRVVELKLHFLGKISNWLKKVDSFDGLVGEVVDNRIRQPKCGLNEKSN